MSKPDIKLKNKNKAAEHGFTKITIHDTGLLSSPKLFFWVNMIFYLINFIFGIK
jgi:hypothetical protein